jgi:hypothetical protein
VGLNLNNDAIILSMLKDHLKLKRIRCKITGTNLKEEMISYIRSRLPVCGEIERSYWLKVIESEFPEELKNIKRLIIML